MSSLRELIKQQVSSRPGRIWKVRDIQDAVYAAGWVPEGENLTPRIIRTRVSCTVASLYDAGFLSRINRGAYRLATPTPKVSSAVDVTDAGTWHHANDTVPYGCDVWRGAKNWFQHEARKVHKLTDHHLWLVTTCKTLMCLNHIKALRPQTLDYLPDVCVYCGWRAESKDHLVPRGWSGETDRSYVLTVPACRECNNAIGAKWAPTITERRAIAHAYIKRRYKKHLSQRRLTDRELMEFGRNLRGMIQASQEVGQVTRDRVAWPTYPDYDLAAAMRSGIDDPYTFGILLPPQREPD